MCLKLIVISKVLSRKDSTCLGLQHSSVLLFCHGPVNLSIIKLNIVGNADWWKTLLFWFCFFEWDNCRHIHSSSKIFIEVFFSFQMLSFFLFLQALSDLEKLSRSRSCSHLSSDYTIFFALFLNILCSAVYLSIVSEWIFF